jgi:hypothetical protein
MTPLLHGYYFNKHISYYYYYNYKIHKSMYFFND